MKRYFEIPIVIYTRSGNLFEIKEGLYNFKYMGVKYEFFKVKKDEIMYKPLINLVILGDLVNDYR